MLTARMRAVSGEKRRRRRRSAAGATAAAGRLGWPSLLGGRGPGLASSRLASAVAVTVSDAIERLDLCELGIDDLELLAQPLDVAVDGTVVDVDVLAVGGVHQLVTALHVARTR